MTLDYQLVCMRIKINNNINKRTTYNNYINTNPIANYHIRVPAYANDN